MSIKHALAAAMLCAVLTPTPAMASCVPPATPAPNQDPACFPATVQEPNNGFTMGLHIPAASDGMLVVSYPTSTSMGFGDPQPDLVSRTWIYRAELPNIQVIDSRVGGKPWSISGQITSVASPLEARWFGWTPRVVVPGSGAVAGVVIDPATYQQIHLGGGFAAARVLASAPEGHGGIGVSTLIGAKITVWVPMSMPTGDYSAVLTITMLG